MSLGEPICNRVSFHEEAQYQLVCAACQKPGPFHAHHVIYEGILQRELGLSGRWLDDTRNALRLCTELVGNCHMRHHWAFRKVKTTELTDDNIEYAFEKLQARAADWLRQYYDDSDEDERILKRELGLEA